MHFKIHSEMNSGTIHFSGMHFGFQKALRQNAFKIKIHSRMHSGMHFHLKHLIGMHLNVPLRPIGSHRARESDLLGAPGSAQERPGVARVGILRIFTVPCLCGRRFPQPGTGSCSSFRDFFCMLQMQYQGTA